MERYNEIVSRSLIDFEEIKLVLANNNIQLVDSVEIKERYFLNKKVSFKNSDYKKIIENSYVLSHVNEKLYLSYITKEGYEKVVSRIEVNDESECIDFLNHIGFVEVFEIEKNIYNYSDQKNQISVINLIGIGLFLSIKKEETNIDQLREILISFNIPFDEKNCDMVFEKLVINKLRRYMK